MRRQSRTMFFGLSAAVLLTPALLTAAPAARAVDSPPAARVAPVTDDYFGTKITDPYRWMESEPQPEFNAYLHAENDYARAVLARIPGRDALAHDIGAVTGALPRVDDVTPDNGQVFFLKRDAGGQIARLYVRDAQGRERLLVDPQRVASGHAHAEIDQFAPSDDGSLVAYGVSIGGSENSTLHVIETATGAARPDIIDRAKFAGVSWAPDGKSFFFTRLPESAATASATEQYAHQKIYQHRLGEDPAHDSEILDADHLPFAFKAAATFPSVSLTAGSDVVLAEISDGVSPELALYAAHRDAVLAHHPDWKLLATQDDDVVGAAVHGDRIDLLTHKNAQHFRIVETTLAAPDLAHAHTLVPEGPGVITVIAAASDGLYWATRDGATFHLHRLPNGRTAPAMVALPFAGTIEPPETTTGGLTTDPTAPGAYVGLESWVHPRIWFRYDPASGRMSDTHLLPAFPRDLAPYVAIETPCHRTRRNPHPALDHRASRRAA